MVEGNFLGIVGKAFLIIIESAIKTGGAVISYFFDAILQFLEFLSIASPSQKIAAILIFFVITIVIFKFIVQSIKSLLWFLILLGSLAIIALLI